MPEFEENAPTFAENALGKALHFRNCGPTKAEDSNRILLFSPMTLVSSCLRLAARPE